MDSETKALIILERLEEALQIDWNKARLYIKAIKKGLKDIQEGASE